MRSDRITTSFKSLNIVVIRGNHKRRLCMEGNGGAVLDLRVTGTPATFSHISVTFTGTKPYRTVLGVSE